MKAMLSWVVVLGVACSDSEETPTKEPPPVAAKVSEAIGEPALEIHPGREIRDP